MSECIMCKGNLTDKKTNFIADIDNCIIIVKGVPSQVCSQCGEVSYSYEVATQIEKIVNRRCSSKVGSNIYNYNKTK